MKQKLTEAFLRKKAQKIRKDIITLSFLGKRAHISSALSITDILTVLYFSELIINPKNPKQKNRDMFFLGKGHAGVGLFATLAERKFFPSSWLKMYGKDGSIFGVHPIHATIPGVELSTGSLGHALSVATGVSYAAKIDEKQIRSFVLSSDAEIEEGTMWEAILFAGHHRLNNLILIIDYNRMQAFGKTEDVANLDPLTQKFESFGWNAVDIDGNDISELLFAFSKARRSKKPTVIIANTVVAKGINFMEGKLEWHYNNLTEEQYEKALVALKK